MPEQLPQAQKQPWHTVRAHACGKLHEFKVEVLAVVHSPLCGKEPGQMVVIASSTCGIAIRRQTPVSAAELFALSCMCWMQTASALVVGAYAVLLWASPDTYWQTAQPQACRCRPGGEYTRTAGSTAGRLINQLRYELWAHAMRPESSAGFMSRSAPDTKSERLHPRPAGAIPHMQDAIS